jgi:hypothetical protein
MYDPDDPFLARVRQVALALPGAAEKESHGRPAFFTQKVFGYYGGSVRVDGDWEAHDQAVLFLPDSAERPALEADERFWVPAYLGPSGWLGLDLDEGSDFDEVAELLEESFRATAQQRLVAELDEGGRSTTSGLPGTIWTCPASQPKPNDSAISPGCAVPVTG